MDREMRLRKRFSNAMLRNMWKKWLLFLLCCAASGLLAQSNIPKMPQDLAFGPRQSLGVRSIRKGRCISFNTTPLSDRRTARAFTRPEGQILSHFGYSSNPPEPSQTLIPSEEIPPLPSSDQMTKEYEGSFIRVLASIIGVILLIIATFWILKKLGRGHFGKLGSTKSIQILERRPLSPKTVLFLVQIENKRILLSESQLEVRGLATVEELESE